MYDMFRKIFPNEIIIILRFYISFKNTLYFIIFSIICKDCNKDTLKLITM